MFHVVGGVDVLKRVGLEDFGHCLIYRLFARSYSVK